MVKYNPSGVRTASWIVVNPNNISVIVPRGMACLGNHLYTNSHNQNGTNNIISYTIGQDSISTDNTSADLNINIVDMASCAGFDLKLPTITVSPAALNTCTNTPATLTAITTEPGTAPHYQWLRNSQPIAGANSATYTYTPANGDTITCRMESSSYCASQVVVTSAPVIISVLPILTPSVSITTPDTGINCAGNTLMFSASSINGGTVPTYQWIRNGMPVSGATGSIFTSGTLANGDIITVSMTTSYTCASRTGAVSNALTVHIGAPTPSVMLTATPASICAGDSIAFYATTAYGGSNPLYQWLKNGLPFAGAPNNMTFKTASLQDNDQIALQLTSSIACASPRQVISLPLTIQVTPAVTPGININTLPPTTLCPGAPVIFVTNQTGGGITPAYQWYKNGTSVPGATMPQYMDAALQDMDTISVALYSSAGCPTAQPTISNKVGVHVIPYSATSAIITVNPSGAVRPGEEIIFTVQGIGGTTSRYQWLLNGRTTTNTGTTWATDKLEDGDVVQATIENSDPCAQPLIAYSNNILVHHTATGISTPDADGLSIFPNPGGGLFTISTDHQVSGTVTVYSVTGERILRQLLTQCRMIAMDLTKQAPGNYTVQLQTERGRTIKKLTIVR